MAAAYAALLSLFHTLNQIKTHPCPPISLDQKQLHSLIQNITFLQDFLERYSGEEDEELESIAAAAYAAEDVIETHIVDRIHARSNIPQGRRRVMKKGMKIKKKVMNIMGLHSDLYGGLKIVIRDMDLIKRRVVETIQQKLMMTPQYDDLHTNSSVAASTWQSSTTPVFDDAIIIQVLDKLVGQQSSLQIVPIVGMGGIGKTTLAKYIYEKPLILQHFDTLAWVTISQEYSRRSILQLLCQEIKVSKNVSSEMSEDEIGLVLYQRLFGRRYFIVLDDIWSVEAWYTIKSYFPDDNNGSRIMITTRLSNLAFELSGSHIFQMQFLHENKSWDLLCETVFGKQDCPTELEDIGKQIARKCRGLPLSIGVIGGLLRKSNMTRAYWTYTLENLNSLVNIENDEYASRILGTSYEELPIHLKPCFLYMGIFPEDKEIRTSMLRRLWVAEGIVRPIEDKSLEEVAEEYLKELIDRNLVLVAKLRWDGEAKFCKMHDVLRDVCLREAQKQKFFCVLRQQEGNTPKDINMKRRIYINGDGTLFGFNSEFIKSRTLLYREHICLPKYLVSFHLGLLRVYSPVDECSDILIYSDDAIFEHANLRYLSLKLEPELEAVSSLRSLCCLLWNLQTLRKLESLCLNVRNYPEVEEIRRDLVSFPHSLKKLSLCGTKLSWEELTIRIGSLPLLQFLKLSYNACRGAKWETVEGHFCSLRVLKIGSCYALKYWETDSAHFPRLEHLFLRFLPKLEEIPSSIGDIPTLKSIELEHCSKSAEHSAKRIKVEQEENGNEQLQIIIGGKVIQVDSDVEDQEEDKADLDENNQFDLDED